MSTLIALREQSRCRYVVEVDPYKGRKVPTNSIGWGFLDYLLGNVVIADLQDQVTGDQEGKAEEQEEEEDEEEVGAINSPKTVLESKQRMYINNQALAQVCGWFLSFHNIDMSMCIPYHQFSTVQARVWMCCASAKHVMAPEPCTLCRST